MLDKKTIISIAAFVVLLLIVLLVRSDPYDTKIEEPKDVWPTIVPDDIDKIEIVRETESISLEKRASGWVLASHGDAVANDNFVKTLLDRLEKLEISHLISDNPDKHGSFEVDEKGARLKLFKGGTELASIIVGKNTADYSGSFVRLPDDNLVYATKGVIRSSIVRKPDDWRDKSILNLNQDSIVKVSIDKLGKGENLVFAKSVATPPDGDEETAEAAPPAQDTWTIDGKPEIEIDMNRLRPLLSGLSRMNWAEIVDEPGDPAEYHMDKPRARVVVTMKDGSEFKLTIADGKSDKDYWLLKEGEKPIYLVRKYQGEKFFKEVGYFDKNAEGEK